MASFLFRFSVKETIIACIGLIIIAIIISPMQAIIVSLTLNLNKKDVIPVTQGIVLKLSAALALRTPKSKR